MHLFTPNENNRYDIIISRDLFQELGIDILNSSKSFKWDGIEVPMVSRGHWSKMKISEFWKQEKNSELDEDAEIVATRHIEEACAMKTILAAKYEPINITTVVNAQDHLTIPEKMALSKILSTRIKIFQVLLGSWKGKQIYLEFVLGAKPHACRPFPIPQIYKKLVKEEVQ